MESQHKQPLLPEEFFKDEEFDVSFFSIEFPDGNLFEYEA